MHLKDVQGKVDFGIITILADEFTAMLARLDMQAEPVSGRRQYNLGRVSLPGGESYRVAVVCCIEQGNAEAQSVAHDLLEDLRPRWLLVVGIAGGVPSEKLGLGDVVVSKRIIDLSLEARLPGGDAEYSPRGGAVEKSAATCVANLPARKRDLGDWASAESIGVRRPSVEATEDALDGDETWRSRVRQSLARLAEHPQPVMLTGTIASSDRLIKDAGWMAEVLKMARHVLAIDMESAGVYQAALGHQVPVLSIRGISDVVGLRREPAWATYACHTAASFALALLRTRPFEPASQSARDTRAHPLRPLVTCWPLPQVQDVDPYQQLGVTESGLARQYAPQAARPPYVSRDVDSELDEALSTRDLVLLVGHSKSGKSRTAFEAVLRLYPRNPLLIPSGREALAELLRLEPTVEWGPAPAIVWLDDLERFLGPGGLTASVLNLLLQEKGRVKLLGTLTARRYADYLRASSDVDKDIQLLLRRFREVQLDSELSPDELRHAQAAYPGEQKEKLADGLGEHLVAAHELVRRYDAGKATCPQGHASVCAAIDWRRAGMTRPIPGGVLQALTARYVHFLRLPHVDVTAESFEEGLTWAREPISLRIALLSKVEDDGAEKHFEAFDYLADHLDDKGEDLPPDAWAHILAFASATEAVAVGLSAYRRGKLAALHKALELAIQSGEPAVVLRAIYFRGVVHQEAGRLEEAERDFRQTVSSEEVYTATWSRYLLGHLLQARGELGEAERLYREAIRSPESEPASAAVHDLGLLLQNRGELEEAERHYRAALDSEYLAAAAIAANSLGLLLQLKGERAEAERLFKQAIASGHPSASNLGVQNLARLLIEEGELDQAERFLRDIALSNPDNTVMAVTALGKVLEQRGNLETAERLYLQGIDARQPDVKAFALINLGQHYSLRGEPGKAEDCYRQAIALRQFVSDSARALLGTLFQDRGELAQAEQLYRPVLLSPDSFAAALAASYLGLILEQRNELEEARRLFQRAIDSRQTVIVPLALCNLGSLLQDQGEHEQAIALFRQALSYKNSADAARAHLYLALSLAELKSFEEAEQHYRAAASNDSDYIALATGAIGELHEKRGRLAEAEQLYRTALTTENKVFKAGMQVQLGKLLLRKGERGEAIRLLEDAAGSEDPDVANEARAVLAWAARARKPPRG